MIQIGHSKLPTPVKLEACLQLSTKVHHLQHYTTDPLPTSLSWSYAITMASNSLTPTPPLFRLPAELIVQISTNLQLPALLAFKLATRHTYFTLPAIKPSTQELRALSTCARLALSKHLQFRQLQKRCALCKHRYPPHLFQQEKTPQEEQVEREKVLEKGHSYLGGPGMVEIPRDVCLWHQSRFVTVYAEVRTYLDRRFPEVSETGWYSRLERLCLHCDAFMPLEPTLSCDDCDTCGFREVRTFFRFEDCRDRCGACYVIWKDENGIMFAREWNGSVSSPDGRQWYFPLLDGRSLLTVPTSGDDRNFRDRRVLFLDRSAATYERRVFW